LHQTTVSTDTIDYRTIKFLCYHPNQSCLTSKSWSCSNIIRRPHH